MASRHCRGSPAACSGTRGGHHTQHANAKPHRRRRRSVSCFSVRDAYIEDLDAICDIEHKCFGLKNSWKEEDLEKQFRHSFARMMVYHDEGNTVCFPLSLSLSFIFGSLILTFPRPATSNIVFPPSSFSIWSRTQPEASF